MFRECGCITTNKECTYHKYTSFGRSIFSLPTDINFTSLAFSSVKICSFEQSMVKDTARNSCHFKHLVSKKLDAIMFHLIW